MIKHKHFTLLEVLIAMLLISITLPVLITPFFYASVDQRETMEKIRLEKAAQFSITLLLVDLQTKQISPKDLEIDRAYPIKSEWVKGIGFSEPLAGTYTFKKLRPTRNLQEQGAELWQVNFALRLPSQKEPTAFKYQFILLPIETPI